MIVESAYDMPGVSAKLNLVYVINNAGAVKVTQKLTADKNVKVSNMFRFGLQMPMPRSFETVEYYGRGPVENYIDCNHCADLGIYRQSVAVQGAVLSLHPSAGKWNKDRYSLVEDVGSVW